MARVPGALDGLRWPPVIDLHSHILPALDDGAEDVDASLAIARALVADGVRVVAGTPHVREDYPTTPDQMEAALEQVREAVAREGLPLDVRGGAEIALGRLERLEAGELARFGLGGNPRLVLLEYPYHGQPLSLTRDCARLRDEGIVVVVAHPERNNAVQEYPEALRAPVEAGAIVQLTAASLDGRLGRAAADCSRRLLDLELAHLVATDVHAAGRRPAGLAHVARAVGDEPLARWLTEAVPAALLAGEPLPARPAPAPPAKASRSLFRRRPRR